MWTLGTPPLELVARAAINLRRLLRRSPPVRQARDRPVHHLRSRARVAGRQRAPARDHRARRLDPRRGDRDRHDLHPEPRRRRAARAELLRSPTPRVRTDGRGPRRSVAATDARPAGPGPRGRRGRAPRARARRGERDEAGDARGGRGRSASWRSTRSERRIQASAEPLATAVLMVAGRSELRRPRRERETPAGAGPVTPSGTGGDDHLRAPRDAEPGKQLPVHAVVAGHLPAQDQADRQREHDRVHRRRPASR